MSQHDNERMAQLRQQEEDARRDAEALRHEQEQTDEATVADDPDAPEPGHLGNDLSKMTLLETDLEQIAKSGDDREPIEGVQEAVAEIQAIHERVDEAEAAEAEAAEAEPQQ